MLSRMRHGRGLRLFGLWFGIIAATVLAFALPLMRYLDTQRLTQIELSERGSLLRSRHIVDSMFKERLGDARVLTLLPEIREYLGKPDSAHQQRVADILRSYCVTYNEYDQLRILDLKGMELIHINANGGRCDIAPPAALQNKALRYYFKEALKLQPGQFHLSPMDLNVEHGRIELPPKPTLRISTLLSDDHNTLAGVLVLNSQARHMLNNLTESNSKSFDYLLNHEGYFLKANKHPELEFSFMYERDTYRFDRMYPEAWQAMLAGKAHWLADDGLYLFNIIPTPIPLPGVAAPQSGSDWYAVRFLPNSELFATLSLQGAAAPIWIGLLLLASALLALPIAMLQLRRNELEETRLTLESMLAAAPNGILVADLNGRLELANNQACQLFGYAVDELLGQPVEMLIPEAQRSGHARARAGFVDQGQLRLMGQGLDVNGLRKNGSQFPAMVSLNVIDTPQGKRVVSIIRDITAERRAERRLADKAAQVSELYNKAPCGYHSLDVNGVIININDTELHWLGYQREEVVGKRRITDFMTPVSVKVFKDNFPKIRDSAGTHDIQIELVSREGKVMPVLVSVTVERDAHGTFKLTRSVLIDYTQLRLQQETLQHILAASPMAVRIASLPDLRVLFTNQAFCNLVQRSEEEAMHLDVRSCYVDQIAFDQIANELAQGQAVLNRLVQLRLPDKPEAPEVWALASYMVIEYHGKPATLAGLFDVTDLQLARQEAESANSAKSSFLATMSHEIRTPLNTMIGTAFLLGYSNLDAEQRQQLDTIHSASKALLALINDILDFSKIEAGEFSLDPHPFRLAELIEEVRSMFAPMAAAKNISLQVPPLPVTVPASLVGDSNRLRQMLINLIGNAIKFTPRGSVRLDVARDEGSDLRLRFSVTDTGIGITPEQARHLFQPFTQADVSTTRRFGGTGLGLSIVKRLADFMGGSITLESAPKSGARFTLTLPFEPADETQDDAVTPDAPQNDLPPAAGNGHGRWLEGVRIMVVDDSQMNLDAIGRILERAGASPTLYESGGLALTSLHNTPNTFDAILMDLQMPGMDGCETTQWIRRMPEQANLPIIALTAGATTTEQQRALSAGMNAFLTKPVDPVRLVRVLRQQVEYARGHHLTAVSDADGDAPSIVSDWPQIEGIDANEAARLLGGDAAFFGKMLAQFVNINPAAPEDLRTLLAQGKLDDDAAHAHKLRGQAGSIGAIDLQSAAAALEEALASGPNGIEAILDTFSKAHATLLRSAQAWLEAENP